MTIKKHFEYKVMDKIYLLCYTLNSCAKIEIIYKLKINTNITPSYQGNTLVKCIRKH